MDDVGVGGYGTKPGPQLSQVASRRDALSDYGYIRRTSVENGSRRGQIRQGKTGMGLWLECEDGIGREDGGGRNHSIDRSCSSMDS